MGVLKKYIHAWEIKVLVCTMVYAFFLILSESNAGYSISLSLLLIYTVWNYKYGRYGTDSKFPRPILIAYGSFFTCLFIAAVFQSDRTTMQLTLKYLSWAFPFIPMFYGYVKEKSEAGLFLGAGLAMFILSLYGWLQIPAFFQHDWYFEYRIHSIFVSPNGFAQVLEQGIPVCIAGAVYMHKLLTKDRKNRIVGLILIIQCFLVLFSLIPFVLSLSRGSISGFLAGGGTVAVVYLIRLYPQYFKRIGWGLSLVLFMGISYIYSIHIQNTNEYSVADMIAVTTNHDEYKSGLHRPYDNERLLMWQSSYRMWENHKLYGVGFNHWKDEYVHYILPQAMERDTPMPHNNIAFFFSATGLIGGIGYLILTGILLCYLLYLLYNNPENILVAAVLWGFIALTVHGQVDAGITNKFVMRIFFGMLGIMCASVKKQNFKGAVSHDNSYPDGKLLL